MGGIIGTGSITGVFPGQGSEYPGMLGPIEGCPGLSRVKVDDVFGGIREISGKEVYPLAKRGPEADLRSPLVAQLSVFGTSVCYFEALKKRYDFSAFAGHSLGFYTALYAAGSMRFEDSVHMIIEAQSAIEQISEGPSGAWEMAAIIGLKVEDCEALCERAGGVYVANVNSASQSVISGKADMVKYVAGKALEAGALGVRELGIPHPLHSPYMAGIKDRLMPFVEGLDISEPRIPIFGHTDGYAGKGFLNRQGVKETLAGQLERKVLWRDVVLGIGAKRFVEIGPGSVLSKLIRWIDRDAEALTAEELICKTG